MRAIRKWLTQAEEDLKAAKDSLKDEHYDWVCLCFISQHGIQMDWLVI